MLSGLLILVVTLITMLVIFIYQQIGKAGVKLTFKDKVTIAEVYSKVDPESLINTSSGTITYPEIVTNQLGEYYFEFKVTNTDGFSKVFKHKVHVVDTTAPVIHLDTLTVAVKELPDYQKIVAGVADDNYDGGVEVKNRTEIKDEPGIYPIVYYATDSSGNTSEKTVYYVYQLTPENMDEPFTVKNLVYVSEKIPLPKGYKPQRDANAVQMMNNMMKEAERQGFKLKEGLVYQGYTEQALQYQEYKNGLAAGQSGKYMVPPGYSEHQTGLAFDISDGSTNFEKTSAYKWLIENCANYGFILRYPKGKEQITGLSFEPEHFRYVGVYIAREIMEKGLTLEEYLGLEE